MCASTDQIKINNYEVLHTKILIIYVPSYLLKYNILLSVYIYIPFNERAWKDRNLLMLVEYERRISLAEVHLELYYMHIIVG